MAELPELKPPPYSQTKTAFFASPVCGFVQTFRLRQSSLYTPFPLLNKANVCIPTAVTFAAAIPAAVTLLEPLCRTGHE